MKTSFYLLLASLSLISSVALAQDFREDPRFGTDPAKREQNVRILNFFNDAYGEKDYSTATVYLRELIENAPLASGNMYIFGANIYRSKVQASTTREERKIYIDSLIWLYNKRIEAFGDDPFVARNIRINKAKDFMHLNPSDRPRVFQFAEEAMSGDPLDLDLSVKYFSLVVESYKLGDITAEDLLDKYDRLDKRLAASQGPAAADATLAIESLFASSGAASCENIEKIYRPKYAADPTNPALIENILSLLQRGQCETPFRMELLEKYYAANPRPDVAMQLASYFQDKRDHGKAMEYLRLAIRTESDPARRGSLLISAAGTSLNSGAYRDAADFAQQAISLNSSNGYAYLFLANAYAGAASSACGDDFARRTVYWLVVDNLQQARRYLSETDPAQAEAIGGQIGRYAANFPKAEETFFRELQPGQGYTVSCGWINGRTIIRER